MTSRCSYNYVVQGAVRGEISRHLKLERAIASRAADTRACHAQGGYSDCEVYEVLHDESRATCQLRLRKVDPCDYPA